MKMSSSDESAGSLADQNFSHRRPTMMISTSANQPHSHVKIDGLVGPRSGALKRPVLIGGGSGGGSAVV